MTLQGSWKVIGCVGGSFQHNAVTITVGFEGAYLVAKIRGSAKVFDQFGESGLVDTVAATIRFNDDSVSTFLMSDAGSNPAVSDYFV